MDLETNGKKYQLIYADPPWKYDFEISRWKKLTDNYNVMELEDIKNIPIEKIIDKRGCILFLWATAPKLKEALEVMDAWGFEYKTHCIWHKVRNDGLGYWFRGQHELLLVGTIGNYKTPDRKKIVPSVIMHKKTKHSKKPDKIRYMLQNLFPDYNKVELFARDRFEGWNCYGNELSKTVQKLL